MCTGLPMPQASITSRSRNPAGYQDGPTEIRRHGSAGLLSEGAAAKALAADIERAQRSIALQIRSVCASEISSMRTIENEISRAYRTELQQLEQVAAGFSSLRALNPFLEAERERWKRLEEVASPHRQLLESMTSATSAIKSITAELNNTVLDAARRHSQMLQQATTSALASQAAGVSSLYIPARIHAVATSPAAQPAPRRGHSRPRGAGQPAERPRAKSSLLIPIPGRSSEVDLKSKNQTDAEQTRHLLSLLNRFLESEEISADAKEGLTGAIAWFKLNQGCLSPHDGRKLNTLIHVFLRDQQGLGTPPEFHQLLSSGLLIPKPSHLQAAPELEPRIYTSTELAKELNYNEASIRRKAKAAWIEGGGPQPLGRGSNLYVVGRSCPGGGRKCGWKYQKLRLAGSRKN